jgi:type I restriction enzyme R subunit
MTNKLNENSLAEQPVISWLKEMGYDYEFGPDLAPGSVLSEREDFRQVLLRPRLERCLQRINPELSMEAINEAINTLKHTQEANIDLTNRRIFKMLTQGIKVNTNDEDGNERATYVYPIDFDNPLNNEFLVVNQYAVQGPERLRRPDVVVFINGIPVAIFEVKNPASDQDDATIKGAYRQLQDIYKKDIPEIFKYNQILVASDLLEAKHGTISASWEWFALWKAVEDEDERPKGISQLETLVQGIFNKQRLLDIIQNFIVFEADSEKDATVYTKKMCMYHQYYGVNKAIENTIRATKPNGDRKVGVFWHTQGSGKTLSMVFYVNKARQLPELKSPSFLFLTDRNDLDDQLYKTFLRTNYPTAKQAESISDLKDKITNAIGEIMFTTIQKFEFQDELSDKDNIIVIADEAHRSQYAKLAGNVRDALPNASFMGITGTPISMNNRDTRLVFGDHISVYSIDRAVEDEATVPIYYEGRLVPLHLTNQFIDDEYDQLFGEGEIILKEDMKKKFANLEGAAGAKERLEKIAADIVKHYNNRGLEGKAMIVTISRRVAVDLYNIIKQQPNAPELAVVISKAEDFKGQMQEETDCKEIEKRFKNPNDSLKVVIVCDMWLTGFDVPCLHTMYIDKPLKNHTLMQAIARVNRIFKNKPGGLIVDYIGIGDNLKKALSLYSSDIQKQAMIPIEEVIAKMNEKYDIVKPYFSEVNYISWKQLGPVDLARLFQEAVNGVITDQNSKLIDEGKKKRFLKESEILYKLFSLVMPHREANKLRDDIEFFQAVKKAIIKRIIIDAGYVTPDTESAIRELVTTSIAAEGIIDIFAMTKKDRPDISIFDDRFLAEVKEMKFKNLSIEVLRKLLRDELRIRLNKNIFRYKSLRDLLEDIIEKYENNILNSTKVIEKLIDLAKEIKGAEKAGQDLGLSNDEVAFYDVIASAKKAELKNGDLKDMVKELVAVIKRDLSVDWLNQDVIRSRIKANVKLLLIRKKIKEDEREQMMNMILQQAYALYRDYVPVMANGIARE